MAEKKGVMSYPITPINFSPEIPNLARITDKTKINVRYSLIAPFSFEHIYWDSKTSVVRYEIEEPTLDEK